MCKLVKYCSSTCQKAHRPQHKKACKQRAAELYDEQLFKEVELDECPICMLPVVCADQTVFKPCCGKVICKGCILVVLYGSKIYPRELSIAIYILHIIYYILGTA